MIRSNLKWFYLNILIIVLTFFGHETKEAFGQAFKSRFEVEEISELPVKLIPFPQNYSWNNRYSQRISSFSIKGIDEEDEFLYSQLEKFMIDFGTPVNDNGFEIKFSHDESIPVEGYKIDVSRSEALVTSSTSAGQYYAFQTIKQLFELSTSPERIPQVSIYDYPKYEIRGFMLDVGRNYQTMKTLKSLIDDLAFYKLNTFHWHLTDRPAWRIESKTYPQLIASENHRATRDPGLYYTYDEIREIIQYAKDRNVKVIPEIDMPGHSDSFTKSMGFKMESEQGRDALKNILQEFFDEIPREMCPIIHIGSDEVHIPDPELFIAEMVEKCEENDREVVVWNPGLIANNRVIRQTWQGRHIKEGNYREIDSWDNYVNNGEPITQIGRLFFKPIGHNSPNDIIGGILCLWPDVNLDQGEDAFKVNPLYPSLMTYAWATWTADLVDTDSKYITRLPDAGTEPLEYYKAFEEYLLKHTEKYYSVEPFQLMKHTELNWDLYGPFDEGNLPELSKLSKFEETSAIGTTIIIRDRFKQGGYFPDIKPGQTVMAETVIKVEEDKEIKVLIGFETPLRANRNHGGIPENNSWDPYGGKVFVNDEELLGPKWQNPGWKTSREKGWGTKEEQEIPWMDEELWWTRNPVTIKLKMGDNVIRFIIPYAHDYQNCMFSFSVLNEQ